jgi:hypothetical protein
MVLDFTSLLDVILIILFLVLCTMNGKARKDADKIDDLTAQNEAYEAQVAEQGEKIAGLEEKNTELDSELSAAQTELEQLKEKYAALEKENEYNKQIAQQAQENLKQYMEMGGYEQGDLELFGWFKEKVYSIEILMTTSDVADTPDAILTMKIDGKQIGRSFVFDPGKTSNKDIQYEATKGRFKTWFKGLVATRIKNAGSPLLIVTVSYKNGEVPLQGPEAVFKMINYVDLDPDNGYIITQRENQY